MAEIFVGPASVAPDGFGLYSLRNFEVGEFLPVSYNGLVLPEAEMTKLEDYMLALANSVEEKGRPPNQAEIDYLKRKWGVKVKHMYRDPHDWHWRPHEHPRTVDWGKVYDHFSDYSFEYFDKGGKSQIIYWPFYNHDGSVVVDERQPENAALMVNEPPNMDYYFNEFTQQATPVFPNVVGAYNPAVNRLGLKVVSPVRAGEEFLLCYGPLYRRLGYLINTSPITGCGRRDHIASFLKPNFRYDQPLRNQISATWRKRLAQLPAQTRDAFYTYLDLINRHEGRVPLAYPDLDNTYQSGMQDWKFFEKLEPYTDLIDHTSPTGRWQQQRQERNATLLGPAREEDIPQYAFHR